MYQIFIFLLFLSSNFYGNKADSESTEEFLNMVTENLNAITAYSLPIDNSKLLTITEDTVGDYGTFDFIIAGGGSAGTVIATRLSEKNFSILLLEAGGEDTEFTKIPGLNYGLQYSDMNWGYFSTPQETCCLGMKNNSCVSPRGKVLGGSSVLGEKVYARGNKADYDNWAAMGNEGWSYDEVLPYFMKSEHSYINNGEEGYHSTSGPQAVSYIEPTVFTSAFINGMEYLGLNEIDYNGESQMGVSAFQFNIDNITSANNDRSFLSPVRSSRSNLNVTTNAFVTKILIKDKTANGVKFVKGGKTYTAVASKEVIVSAGAINSPQILMLSGIGPKNELTKLGIDVVADLPVGQDMRDHPFFVGLNFRTNQTLYTENTTELLKAYLNGHRPYIAPLNADSHAFVNVDDATSTVPNIQICMAAPFDIPAERAFNLNEEYLEVFANNHNANTDFQFWLALLYPKSKGSVTLKSSDPKDFPNINYNYYSDKNNEDIETMYKGVVKALEILNTEPMRAINATYQSLQGSCSEHKELSKDYWYCAIRHMSTSYYHPTSTTRMGSSTDDSVVDKTAKVHGIGNLRVIDAGIFPEIIAGNTNAPVTMVAEKLSDIIKAEYSS